MFQLTTVKKVTFSAHAWISVLTLVADWIDKTTQTSSVFKFGMGSEGTDARHGKSHHALQTSPVAERVL